ncbi:carbohydrate kinase family protein [Nocardioides sp. AX2bis]|uniref:carbohydrate kinase family protein n=1 Tax=Nocardioides sp. AX2bis TaxID=2653157 RepID=UPI001F20A81F|nr:carbohydrate kinase family protein [Nocardioides sp. AX2bis]
MVFGGANLDVLARSTTRAVAGTSNPGRVTRTPGGVGRNVAENLARLGTPVRLVAAVGQDDGGARLLEQTRAAGVDVDLVRRVGAATGSYTAVVDSDGELVVAVSDMRATELLGPADVAAAAAAVAGAALVVVDGNLTAAAVEAALGLAAQHGTAVVLEPVSVPKARVLAPVLDRWPVRTVTPNVAELAALTARSDDPDDPDDPGPSGLEEQVASLHARGVAQVWVRMGPEGSLLSTPDGVTHHASVDVEVVDATGAGDALLAAYCHALLAGAAPEEAAAYGQAAAALTVAGPHTVRPDLSDALVRSLL